jgi:hypothetical protein
MIKKQQNMHSCQEISRPKFLKKSCFNGRLSEKLLWISTSKKLVKLAEENLSFTLTSGV